jgi:hypothetical protein
MAYTLEQFAADCHRILNADAGPEGRKKVCALVQMACSDPEFVAKHLPENGPERKILYEDPQLGFCICGHVYPNKAIGGPHDHGSSWAIYGQAAGVTEMTEWKVVDAGGSGKPKQVEPVETYVMNPGDVRLYDVGVVHSPKRDAPVKLIRIEGRNLDHVERSHIKAKEPVAAP